MELIFSIVNSSGLSIDVISGCQIYSEPVSPEIEAIRPQDKPSQRCKFLINLLKIINDAIV